MYKCFPKIFALILCSTSTTFGIEGPTITALDSLQELIDKAIFHKKFSEVIRLTEKTLLLDLKEPIFAERIGQFHFSRAIAFRQIGDYTKCLEHYRAALKLRKPICGPSSLDVGSVYLNLGNLYWNLNQIDSAEYYLHAARNNKLAHLPSNHKDLAPIYNSIGTIEMQKGRLNQAEKYFRKGFSIVKHNHLESPHLYVPYGLSLVKLLQEKGMLNEALSQVQKMVEAFSGKAFKDFDQLGSLFNFSGNILSLQGQFQQALTHFDTAASYLLKSTPLNSEAYGDCLQNQALTYIEIGDFGPAITNLNAALHYYPAHSIDQAIIFQHLGLVHYYLGDFDKSLEWVNKCLPIYNNVEAIVVKKEKGAAYFFIGFNLFRAIRS